MRSPRLALDVLREAGEPLAGSEIAIRDLKAKGIGPPASPIRKMTRARLRCVFSALAKRGVVRTVGVGNEAKRELVTA